MNVDNVSRETLGLTNGRDVGHVQRSRAAYYRDWRKRTSYDWRMANAESRARHIDERRIYDEVRYAVNRERILMERSVRRVMNRIAKGAK